MTNDALLTATQAGVLAECSSSTIRRAADAGELDVAQRLPGPNGALLFRPADVRTWAETRLARTGTDG